MQPANAAQIICTNQNGLEEGIETMMPTIPSLESIKKLDGRNFAVLTTEEQAVLTFYRDQGCKFDVAVAILSDADPKELGCASRQQADEIMLRANSHVRITIGKGAKEAWESCARFDETKKLVTPELRGFVTNGMQAGRKSFPRG